MAIGQELISTATLLLFAILTVYGQQFTYTERYPWPGPVTIPAPGDARNFIASGDVYVELPENDSVIRDVQIRPQVPTTFNCSLLINATQPRTITPLHVNFRTMWFLRRRDINGDLEATLSPVANNTEEILIFGMDNSTLRIVAPDLSSTAKQGTAGQYICEHCYDIVNPLNPADLIPHCSNVTGDANVIGYPPTINRRGSLSSDQIRIGMTICLNTPDQFEIRVRCSQNGTINPEPGATYTFNGATPNPHFFYTARVRDEPGDDNAIDVILEELVIEGIQGTLTCVLSNPFGNDTESSDILFDTRITSYSASVQGQSGTGCPGNPANTICPAIGQTVNISCAANFMNSYTISGPNSRTVTNGFLSFVVGQNDYGNYTCVSENGCNQVTSVLTLEALERPNVPEWRTTPWRQCTRECNGGYRTRRVDCILPLNSTVVPNGECPAASKPRNYEICNIRPCILGCERDWNDKLCSYIVGSNSCGFSFVRTICCWSCGYY